MEVVVCLNDDRDPLVEGRGTLNVDEELAKVRFEASRELVNLDLFGPIDVREAFNVLVREVGGGTLLRERLDAARILADEVGGLEALDELGLERFPVREEYGLRALNRGEPRLGRPSPEVHRHVVDLIGVAWERRALKVDVGLNLANELLHMVGLAREVLGLADLDGWDATSGGRGGRGSNSSGGLSLNPSLGRGRGCIANLRLELCKGCGVLFHDAIIVDNGGEELAHDIGLGQLWLTSRRGNGKRSGRAGSRRRPGCELWWRKLRTGWRLKIDGGQLRAVEASGSSGVTSGSGSVGPIRTVVRVIGESAPSGVHVGATPRSRARAEWWTRGMTMAQAVPKLKGRESRARGEQRRDQATRSGVGGIKLVMRRPAKTLC